ncbi:MAG: hypothetical protein KJ043_08290 [Anaerolineae bacterium]|nr:hypothetical protein [Anaerolineae bacterium]
MRRIILIVSMLGIIGVLSFAIPTPTQAEITPQFNDTTQLQGMLNIIYGDPQPDSSDPVITRYDHRRTHRQFTHGHRLGAYLFTPSRTGGRGTPQPSDICR